MKEFESFSVKVKNFKCFGDDPQGFDQIKPINLIIGRNNSGKSTLLDLIPYLVQDNYTFNEEHLRKKVDEKVDFIAQSLFPEDLLNKVFFNPQNRHLYVENSRHSHSEVGELIKDATFVYSLIQRNDLFIDIKKRNQENFFQFINNLRIINTLRFLRSEMKNPFKGKIFKRVFAERDVVFEQNINDVDVKGDGKGITAIIQQFINMSSLERDYVECDLLDSLNKVLVPDMCFKRILCERINSSDFWEIFLEEENKGRIALSQSGSGLKTIFIVLVHLHLLPVKEAKQISDYIFAFEELENNLHPALLRRLLSYIIKFVKNNHCVVFLTTHSNVAIDLFSKNDLTQIVHVTHDGKESKCTTIGDYLDGKNILEDLDVRASDLLQSNGVVWVEGPSDRAYFNKWVEIYSDSQLQEGLHYQCVFYGGKLLSHFEAKEPEENQQGISILKVNRNAIILMDSDLKDVGDSIREAKIRIADEIKKTGGFAWITDCREIENYIPQSVVQSLISGLDIGDVPQYDSFFDYLSAIEAGKGDFYKKRKVMLASEVIPLLSIGDMQNIFDWNEKMEKVCEEIKKWNGL